MIFSDTHWIRENMEKIDSHLRKELLNCYKYSKFIPCFLHGTVNRLRNLSKRIDVIVRYSEDSNRDDLKVLESTLKIMRSKKNRSLNLINSYSTRLTPRRIRKLLDMDAVKAVYLDRKYKALLDTAGPALEAPLAWNGYFTGKGMTTAVIDTGIYPHTDLTKPTNRILAFKDFVRKKSKPYDDNGHGTHVAGDIASNGFSSGGKYKAPAYESSVIGVKVLDKRGSGNLSTIISGIEWCIDNKEAYKIRMINLSLGAPAQQPYSNDLLCEACENAWKEGIIVCAAAGNEGPQNKTISSPGDDPVIITVGAVDDKNTIPRSDDAIAGFSSRGPTVDDLNKPDVISPGVNIISLRSPRSNLDRNMKNSRVDRDYLSLSGTSMATPLCCSCIALLLEKNPKMTPDQVKKKITDTALDMGLSKNIQGYGYIDIPGILDLKGSEQDNDENSLHEDENEQEAGEQLEETELTDVGKKSIKVNGLLITSDDFDE